MQSMSLAKHFKFNRVLRTDVGSFEYKSQLGQGGNAHVLEFSRGTHSFAIKFIPHDDEHKLDRFRDEFFLAAQIPTHLNVVRCFHFDELPIEDKKYSLIVMRKYDSNLHALKSIAHLAEHDQAEKANLLFMNLCAGLKHLHTHHIIHRDIKPQNILCGAEGGNFVLGDLGIAQFKDEEFAKEAHTRVGERLANYQFSAPEQSNGANRITPAADIYALGQVIQWYLTGATIHGLGRPRFPHASSNSLLGDLDAVVQVCLRHAPEERFQDVRAIEEFLKNRREPAKVDAWAKIDAFDNAIRRSFPEIRKTIATSDQERIGEFLNNFQDDCKPADFWYMGADEGDGHFVNLRNLDGPRWLLNNDSEILVEKLLVYRDRANLYKDFFILILAPDQPFSWQTMAREQIQRSIGANVKRDFATIVDDDFYIDSDEIQNGYYRLNGKTESVDRARFRDRWRELIPFGIMVIPMQTASASMNDRAPTAGLINACIQAGEIPSDALETYLKATRDHHSAEITRWR